MKIISTFISYSINEMIYPQDFDLNVLRHLVKQNLSYSRLLSEINELLIEDKVLFMDTIEFNIWFKESGLDKTYPPPPVNARIHIGVNLAAFFPGFEEIIVITNRQLHINFRNRYEFSRFNTRISTIIKHEMIHREQASKKDIEHAPNADVSNFKEYIGHPDELMAFANTAAHELFQKYGKKAFNYLNDKFELAKIPSANVFLKTFNKGDKKRDKFLKYVYMYIQQLIDESTF